MDEARARRLMTSTPAYEIGAIFLLVALLMYGTLSGFIPRSFHAGKPAPIILGVLLLGYALYRFGPDLSSGWRSIANPPNSASPHPTPAAATPATPGPSHAKAMRSATHRQTAANDSVPILSGPAPLANPAEAPGAYQTQPAKPLVAANGAPAPSGEPTSGSPYDSGVKRAIKSVGHFLHIGRKRDQ
jgi:hypothetical protein